LLRHLTPQIAIHWRRDILLLTAIETARGSSDGKTTMAKLRIGLDHRHRDKSGRIERKHGNTKVAALRKEYGPSFAKGRRKDMLLKTLLAETGSASLHDYLKHHHK
jgi:hypothetical protein